MIQADRAYRHFRQPNQLDDLLFLSDEQYIAHR